jgi:hypothetical protein
MKTLLIIIIFTSWSLFAGANPLVLVEHLKVFLAEENLTVEVNADMANIRCEVKFRANPKQRTDVRDGAWVEVPVWLPDDYNKKFITKLSDLNDTHSKLNEVAFLKGICEQTGIQLSINSRPSEFIFIYDSEKYQKSSSLPKEAFTKGFRCLTLHFEISKEDIISGGKVVASWSQPLKIVSKEEHRFFYLPILPEQAYNSASAYSRTVKIINASESTLFLGWDIKDSTSIAPRAQAVLPLRDISPLKLCLKTSK